ncbi:MAG: hypothetical protein ACRDX9_06895 [Acidimicrobiia bacterium]
MAKRAREVARQQKREDKQERQEAKGEPLKLDPAAETGLLEEFARLNDDYSEDRVSESHFVEERHRILVALGIETEEDA